MFFTKNRKLIITENFNSNICNPCLIEVPHWCKNKLGKYYLFYADHGGEFIKLAYSDNLFSNWKKKKDGVLNIDKFSNAINHIASPEIYIDNTKQEIILFTHSHSKSRKGQWTYASKSKDALNFEVVNDLPLAPFYFRIFKYKNFFYGITKGGSLWKTKNFFNKFTQCHNLFDKERSTEILHNYFGAVRHISFIIENNILFIFYTRIGDKPERIYYSKVNLTIDEKEWFFDTENELIRPEFDFEGVNIKLTKSEPGDSSKPENALRDPHIIKICNNYFITYC